MLLLWFKSFIKPFVAAEEAVKSDKYLPVMRVQSLRWRVGNNSSFIVTRFWLTVQMNVSNLFFNIKIYVIIFVMSKFINKSLWLQRNNIPTWESWSSEEHIAAGTCKSLNCWSSGWIRLLIRLWTHLLWALKCLKAEELKIAKTQGADLLEQIKANFKWPGGRYVFLKYYCVL